jgi:hypothetical protein
MRALIQLNLEQILKINALLVSNKFIIGVGINKFLNMMLALLELLQMELIQSLHILTTYMLFV